MKPLTFSEQEGGREGGREEYSTDITWKWNPNKSVAEVDSMLNSATIRPVDATYPIKLNSNQSENLNGGVSDDKLTDSKKIWRFLSAKK